MPSLLLRAIDRLILDAPDPERVGWLKEWTYAHRGLHGHGVPENSLAGARLAIAQGLGIECDIQRSSDGQAMVFHDWDLKRLTGDTRGTESCTAEQIGGLQYLNSDERPAILGQLLELIAGEVPLLIEIKSKRSYDVERSCKIVAEALTGYSGLHAVMSFDPRVARWFRMHSPQTVSGLVMREDDKGSTQQAWQRRLALWIARPEFLAYHVDALPNAMVAGVRKLGLPILTWTVDSAKKLEIASRDADAPIAEGAGVSDG